MSFLEWIEQNAKDGKDIDETLLKDFHLSEIDSYFPEANLTMEIRRLEYLECKKLFQVGGP